MATSKPEPIKGTFVNAETGEVIERELTVDELADLEAQKGTPTPLTPAE